jgi:nucleotide-binding universal stress UspA family protein
MNILVCSDGSSPAENAIRLGALMASACNADITLLGIIENPGSADAILDALRRGLQLLEEKRIRAELVTITGEPIEEIIKRTEQHHFDLVVIGAARKGSRGLYWVSSKAYKIIKTIHPPVLVALEKSTGIKRILVCSSGQKYIANAVALTGQIARGMGASVTLFHVLPEPPPIYANLYKMETDVDAVLNSKSELGRNLREQKRILEEMGVNVEVRLGQGSVLSEIRREIRGGNYDLVVSGSSRSRASLRTYILGDVTREIVNRATCAVMVVRSGITSEGILQSLTGWLDRFTHHQKGSKPRDTN